MYAQGYAFADPKFSPPSASAPSDVLHRGLNYTYDPANPMASDPRYMYPHPGMPYDYGAYPPAAYDPAHVHYAQPPPPQAHPRPNMPVRFLQDKLETPHPHS